MKVEFSPTVPIYLQIIEMIKRQIISGGRVPGSRVESVRDLAQSMGVNPNTGQRAFAELEREGLIITERTTGRYITADVARITKLKEELAQNMIGEFVDLMLKSGFSKQDILRLLEEYLKNCEQQENGR